MTPTQIDSSDSRPLEVLGIGPDEERIYRVLLVKGAATAAEASEEPRFTLRKTQRLLDVLESKGLATRSPERPPRYRPAPPDIAIQALTMHLQQSMQRAQGMIRELQQLAAAGPQIKQEQIIELVSSRDAGRLLLAQVHGSAEHEIDVFVRAPVLYTSLKSSEPDEIQRIVQARGVRVRTINDAEILTIPGALEHIRAHVLAGEAARVLPSLPFKMVLVDRRIALIFLNPEQADNPLMLVRYSALLEAFYTMFEILWDKAAPITFASSGTATIGDSRAGLSAELEQLLPLLTAGLNDKTIAHKLDVSERTVARRIVDLLKVLGARTRFQAGWLAAIRAKSPPMSSQKPRPRSRR
ncbi:MAG: helix-turn-helix domain-containing protein [Dokdonella sp.]|uniref:helix-turn-helix domain-containing protein n=1 Tax=Dokdonella sp. TaxID=2291710 RepID=UPI003267A501